MSFVELESSFSKECFFYGRVKTVQRELESLQHPDFDGNLRTIYRVQLAQNENE